MKQSIKSISMWLCCNDATAKQQKSSSQREKNTTEKRNSKHYMNYNIFNVFIDVARKR